MKYVKSETKRIEYGYSMSLNIEKMRYGKTK